MLPTPDTSHVNYNRVYEPSEDSFLLLDTLSSASETRFLRARFPPTAPAPLVVELGTGSGVVLAFVHAHAAALFGGGRGGVLTAGVDLSAHACAATVATVGKASGEHADTAGTYLGSSMGDLGACWRCGEVDVVIFNPPYVPTPGMPRRPVGFSDVVPGLEGRASNGRPGEESGGGDGCGGGAAACAGATIAGGGKDDEEDDALPFEHESYLLELAYAGGRDGMETTERMVDGLREMLSPRGVAYVLLCAQNRPGDVKARIGAWGGGWRAETVGTSGKTAGWEKLQIVRIWRDGME